MPMISWAQANEDIYLLRALHGIRHDVDNAFYIDVGANDPEDDSVTKLFYDCGWHGVNVEPSPKWYQRLVEQRPRDINIQAAVSDRPGELSFYDHSSGGLGTLVEAIALSHLTNHQVLLKRLTVKTITLTEICEQHAPADIHFLKVDVEGAEGAVLRGMDFSRFRPWVMCIESHVPLQTNLQTHADWDQLVIDSGYQFVFTDMINRYYIANEHAERAVSFKIPIDNFIYARDLRQQLHLENRLNELEQTLRNVQSDRAPAPDQYIAKYFESRADNELYEAMYGGSEPIRNAPAYLGMTSTLCRQQHFSLDEYRYWAKAMARKPRLHRKDWEWFYIAQALFEAGMLKPGKKGLVFAVGREPLPALFASFGCEILATDQAWHQAVESGWANTNQYSKQIDGLFDPAICERDKFFSMVRYCSMNMNAIPDDQRECHDFCWSSCAFEHLGSLERGLDFVVKSLETLKPGGVAVHTTEFNLSSNDGTVESESLSIYRRRDIEELVLRLERADYDVVPFDWTIGHGFAETVVDLPPYKQSPHIRLKYNEYDVTSIGIIVRKRPHKI